LEEQLIVPKNQGKNTISRRGALIVISSSVCAAINLPQTARGLSRIAVSVPGATSDAGVPGASAQGFFTEPQMETIAALSEVIIPADAHSPGARAARVDQYIDEIVGASDRATKDFWIAGLSAVEKLARRHYAKAFAHCNSHQQIEILQNLSLAESRPSTLEERFFVALKRATVDGYYNSEVGIHQDLQYEGNAVLPEFKGCNHYRHT
jgi:hypothetical protein